MDQTIFAVDIGKNICHYPGRIINILGDFVFMGNKGRFTPEQVRILCGGTFPRANGFAWNRVEYFTLVGRHLQPYRGEEILPGPSLLVTVSVDTFPPSEDFMDLPAFLRRQAE